MKIFPRHPIYIYKVLRNNNTKGVYVSTSHMLMGSWGSKPLNSALIQTCQLLSELPNLAETFSGE